MLISSLEILWTLLGLKVCCVSTLRATSILPPVRTKNLEEKSAALHRFDLILVTFQTADPGRESVGKPGVVNHFLGQGHNQRARLVSDGLSNLFSGLDHKWNDAVCILKIV